MDDVIAKCHVFETVEIEIKDFACDGFVLDVGGGGEGVIGMLKGRDCVAIDIHKDELEESAPGPLKILMDARELKFLDNSFGAATAFFSMMYVKENTDQQKIFREVYRVLKPGSHFYLWEIDLAHKPVTDKPFFLLPMQYRVKEISKKTAYGQPWPKEVRGEAYYQNLAKETGFTIAGVTRNKNTFALDLVK